MDERPVAASATAPPLGRRVKRVAIASAAAQVFSQVVTLGQTIVLARLLSPTEVGVFAAGTVLTAFLANFAEGGMRAGLVHRADNLDDAAETVFRGTIVTGFLMSLGALAAAPVIGFVFDSATAGMIAAVTSGSLLLYSLTNVPDAMLQRQFSVWRRLIVGPSIALGFAGTAITLAALGFGVWSLVAGSYVSYLAWVVSVWLISDWRPGRGQASWAEWRRLARFGLPLVLGFVGAKGQQMIESVVVGRGLSTAALGYYRYGMRISRVPVDAIIEIVATALFPAFSRIAGERERMRATYLQALTGVTLFSSVLAGLIVAIGEPGVVVLLGEPWRGAGAAVVAMAGLGLGKGFTSVSEEAIKGNGRTGLLNWLTALEFVLGVGLLVLIIPFGLFGVGLAISITALSVGGLTLFLARPVVGASPRDLQIAILPALVAAVAATAVTYILEHRIVHSDAHGVVAAVALLVFDAAVFLFVYVDVLLILVPDLVLAFLARLRSRLGRSRAVTPEARPVAERAAPPQRPASPRRNHRAGSGRR